MKGVDTLPVIRDLLHLKAMQPDWSEIRIPFLAAKHTFFNVSSIFSEFTKVPLRTEIALTFLSLIFQMAYKVDQTGPLLQGNELELPHYVLQKERSFRSRGAFVSSGIELQCSNQESTGAKLSHVPHLGWATGLLLKSCPEGCTGCEWCKYILLQDKDKEKRDATQCFHRAFST